MNDAEDQVRRYAAAATRAQRPVELGEIVTRPRRGRARRPAAVVLVSIVVVFAIVGTVVLVGRGHGSPTRVEVAPTSSSAVAPAPNCPAASLAVTSTSDERLHAAWLPPGFVLTSGNETDIGPRGGLTYSTPGYGDHPRVVLSLYRNTQPLASLYGGTTQPLMVQGHSGIWGVGVPQAVPLFKAVLWRPAPGIALVANGYKLADADLRRIAENVEYDPGGSFTYSLHPEITVTRAQAFATAGHEINDPHAALTSFGEIDAVSASVVNHLPTLAAGVAVTQPVWVVWTPGSGARANEVHAIVVDAKTGATIATIGRIKQTALDSLTDRSAPVCAPPFGVLTRSELVYLRPPYGGATVTTKFTTEGALISVRALSGFFDCSLDACDSTVPVWTIIQTASDQRFTDMERGPGRRPTNTKTGSWSITMLDARTGPQNTNVGNSGELGGGPAPADVLAVTDLAPS